MIRSFIALLLAPSVSAVTLFQVENFSGSLGWESGTQNPNPPSLLADSGPLGSGDTSLRISANGSSGPGSRLVAYNTTDWTGNYSGLGITSLTLDLRNTSLVNLSIHVAVFGPGGWFVTPGQAVNRFQPWNSFEFQLTPESLLSAGGSSAATTLSGVSEIRILHSNGNSSHRGDVISGQLLVDNLRAVPEPRMLLLGLLASVTIGLRRKR